jgi:hypothetical protein
MMNLKRIVLQFYCKKNVILMFNNKIIDYIFLKFESI